VRSMNHETSRRRPPRDEAGLIEWIESGDLTALDLLVERYGSGLQVYLERIVGDPSLAEDLVHDTFVRIYERPEGLRELGSLAAWLYRIGRNLALDRLRKTSRRDRLRRLWNPRPAASPPPSRRMEDMELAAALESALAELPETFRSVYLLREVDELSYEQISQVLGCSEKTVSSRLNRARARLREALRGFLDDEDRA
jgi:RNA polymerase sigma-70 factor, ECF subfamily